MHVHVRCSCGVLCCMTLNWTAVPFLLLNTARKGTRCRVSTSITMFGHGVVMLWEWCSSVPHRQLPDVTILGRYHCTMSFSHCLFV